MSDIEQWMDRLCVHGFPVECGQFTCYDFSVLDSDRHVAC